MSYMAYVRPNFNNKIRKDKHLIRDNSVPNRCIREIVKTDNFLIVLIKINIDTL